ncbi:hypothetical protein CC80DRAFT_174210 [Byssothecium circinans]|uniref:Uncharacterized protein n=1 Tax=Byssothecium circinans TaxID=147558 RepID=A0A6A5TU58_9PLEO|nr:hypothetical protein CC80DRAFT_174210 [Byssothecium circinans]
MQFTLILALAASALAAPIAQSSYDNYGASLHSFIQSYILLILPTSSPVILLEPAFHCTNSNLTTSTGDYSNVPVNNPAPPAGGYGSYGDYGNTPTPPVNNPPPPAGGYGSYGAYADVPPPAGGYGSYGSYKRDEVKRADEDDCVKEVPPAS